MYHEVLRPLLRSPGRSTAIVMMGLLAAMLAAPLAAAADRDGTWDSQVELAAERPLAVDPPDAASAAVPIGAPRVQVDGPIVFYTDRPTFDADNPGLPLEDFEGSLVPPNGVLACPGPFNSATNNACYAPGTILDGISVNNTNPANLMVVLTQGFLGALSTIVGPNTFVDEMDMSFPNGDVQAAGMDLQVNSATNVDITVFGVGGVLIGSDTIAVSGIGTPTFWGVAANEVIESIHFVAPGGQGELVDDVAFGTSAAPAITLDKTVGTVPMACATTDTITVPLGTTVTYCFFVTNTGNVTLDFHDLFDDHLGTLLNDFPFVLGPGSSAFLPVDDTATATVTNTATWTASTTLVPTYRVDDTVPFNFIDITATGSALGLGDDDEANVTMPFSFELFGTASSDLRIGNNGGILFGVTAGNLGVTNAALPNALVGPAILPFWDDLDSETGDVYWQTLGTAPDRQLVVQWNDRPHFPGPGLSGVTLEVILFEGTNEILFQYFDTDFGNAAWDFGASATAGLNLDATTAVQYSFNTAVLTNDKAILFSPGDASATDSATVIIDPMPFIDGFETGDTSRWTVTVP